MAFENGFPWETPGWPCCEQGNGPGALQRSHPPLGLWQGGSTFVTGARAVGYSWHSWHISYEGNGNSAQIRSTAALGHADGLIGFTEANTSAALARAMA